MTKVLGISCFYHDSAAAIIDDGEIIAAAQEERFSRKRHDPSFPYKAINYCLEEAFIDASELDAVIYYDNPYVSFDRLIKSYLYSLPKSKNKFINDIPEFLKSKFHLSEIIKDLLKVDIPILATRHHLSHAASAFYPSPFNESAILTIDGVGEWATTSICFGENEKIKTIKEIKFPHSLGLLYSAFTYFCGFKVNSGEYKLMGLAPFGEPKYKNLIENNLISIKPDGSYRLNMDYFSFLDSDFMVNDKFCSLFGSKARSPETKITKKEIDIAASIQKVTDDVVMGLAKHAKAVTGSKSLCLAGGVALNCVSNGILERSQLFENIWIQPAAGDAGGALGSALACSHMYFNVKRSKRSNRDSQKGSYLGPSYSSSEISNYLNRNSAVYDLINDSNERSNLIAQYLNEGKIVGFMTGRMEFGPRALGSRSILGDPRNPKTQSTMNLKIKYRESFRPFAPSVLKSEANKWFDLNNDSPYMLLVAPVKKEKCVEANDKFDSDLIRRVNNIRSEVPAITHVDYSARIQTVSNENNPEYFQLISSFYKLTGCPILVNTSFNVRGEPIVCTPEDAYICFMRTEMDMLVIENHILLKEKQIHSFNNDSWRQEYELD